MKLMLDSEQDERKTNETGKEHTEDGPKPLKPWMMALIFAGIAVAAAMICAMIWHFGHLGGQGAGEDIFGQFASGSAVLSELDSDAIGRLSGSEKGDSDGIGVPFGQEGEEADLETGGNSIGGTQGSDESALAPSGEGGSAGNTPASSDENMPTGDDFAGSTKTPTDENMSTEGDLAGNTPAPSNGEGSAGSDTQADPSQAALNMSFSAVEDSVTPKEVVNLRSAPTTLDSANIVTQVKNGEVLSRTGLNEETGWSKLEYQGQTLYAVTGNLTTDLNYAPPAPAEDPNQFTTAEGRVITFKSCDNWVTPKEYANLRTEPSTAQGEATVGCRLEYGARAHRTGYSEDTGWSRVEYNGQVLYVVSSLVFEVEVSQEQETE